MRPVRQSASTSSPLRFAAQKVPPWIGLAAASLLLFLFQANAPLTDGDTAFYGVIARNMLNSGDWQTLHYTDAYGLIDKPPLTIWLIAASFRLFGTNEIAIRGWHALMSAGTVLLLYATGRLFYTRTTASLAGWLLLTSALFAYSGFVPQQDIPLTFFSAMAFYGLARFVRGDGLVYTYVAWIGTALGFLSRGPQALVFPVFVALPVLFLKWRRLGSPRPTRRHWRAILTHAVGGATLFTAIAAPWFIFEYARHGWDIIDLLLGTGQTRFFQSLNRGPDVMRSFAYFPLLIVAFLPWSGLIGHGLRRAFHRIRAGTDDGDWLFLMWFLVAFFLPFLTEWRVIRYLLPALPALAMLVARFLSPVFQNQDANEPPPEAATLRPIHQGLRVSAWLSLLVVVPVLILIGSVYADAFPDDQAAFGRLLMPFLLVLAIGFGAFIVMVFQRQYRRSIVTLISGSLIAYAVLFASVHPNAEVILPSYAAAGVLNSYGDEAVVWAGNGHDPFLEFYVNRRLPHMDPKRIASAAGSGVPEDLVFDIFHADGVRPDTFLLVGDHANVETIIGIWPQSADILWRGDHLLLVRLSMPFVTP